VIEMPLIGDPPNNLAVSRIRTAIVTMASAAIYSCLVGDS
jgi:hypothetical protein